MAEGEVVGLRPFGYVCNLQKVIFQKVDFFLIKLYCGDLKFSLHSCSEESRTFLSLGDFSKTSNDQSSLEFGLSQWKLHVLSAMKELRSMMLRVQLVILQSSLLVLSIWDWSIFSSIFFDVKGGGMFTLAKIYEVVSKWFMSVYFFGLLFEYLK